MPILNQPLGLGRVFYCGSQQDAKEMELLLQKRAAFVLEYMKEKGWGDDIRTLSIAQLMEIREQPEWQNPK